MGPRVPGFRPEFRLGSQVAYLMRFFGEICVGGGVFGGECVGPGIECLGLGARGVHGVRSYSPSCSGV
jgi:hypothetical protein